MTDFDSSPADTSSDDHSETQEAMLTDIEARVLGALMEKQQTTPDVYPLTLNSLVTACNQKTSREPVMNLQNGEVQRCLNQLQSRGLVDIEYGSRADKYEQKLARSLHFDKAEQAVFTLLLLRGPQTLNELFSRSQRMHEFASPQELGELLNHLATKLKPLLVKLPQQPGQREERYMHLLCGEPDLSAYAKAGARAVSVNPAEQSRIDELEQRVAKLEQQLADLLEQLG